MVTDGSGSDFAVFKPYIDAVNIRLCGAAQARDIPCARVYEAFNGMNGDEDAAAKGYLSWDGLHPSDAGHERIADLLRAQLYTPLR